MKYRTPADITVLSFNARDSEAADTVQAAVAVHTDALLLGEVDSGIADSLSQHGMTNQLFTDGKAKTPDPDATAVITSGRLGNHQQVASPASVFGAVSVAPWTVPAPGEETCPRPATTELGASTTTLAGEVLIHRLGTPVAPLGPGLSVGRGER